MLLSNEAVGECLSVWVLNLTAHLLTIIAEALRESLLLIGWVKEMEVP